MRRGHIEDMLSACSQARVKRGYAVSQAITNSVPRNELVLQHVPHLGQIGTYPQNIKAHSGKVGRHNETIFLTI